MPPDQRPLLIAHRYGNRLHLIDEAAHAGADVIEVDVWFHRGNIEVGHDKTLGPIPIRWDRWSLALGQSRELRLPEVISRLPEHIEPLFDLKGTDPRLPAALQTIIDRHFPNRGYLVASTDQGLAARAISVRDSGGSLVRSSTFQRQFPRDGGVHNSGFFWLNTASVADELAALAVFVDLQPLALSREPVLIVLTGESDQVRWSSRTRFTSVLLELMLGQPAGEIGS